jgi:hypothetical protein
MLPRSYKPYPRRCQNCKHVTLLIQTSLLRKAGSDVWACTQNERSPKLPERVVNTMYFTSGFLNERVEGEEPGTKAVTPEIDALYQQYRGERDQWLERNKVSPEGGCSEHRFVREEEDA